MLPEVAELLGHGAAKSPETSPTVPKKKAAAATLAALEAREGTAPTP